MKKIITLAAVGILLSYGSFAAITGTAGCCAGSSTPVTDLVPGGIWSSSNVAVATISPTGMVSGISAGTATISYVVGATIETMVFTVSNTPAPMAGASNICEGATTTYTDAVAGGSWSSDDPTIMSVDAITGVATGVSAGNVLVYYTTGVGCYTFTGDTVHSPTPDTISGPTTVCVGSTITLTDATPGGTWSTIGAVTATVSTSGIVTGVTPGTAIISYTVSGVCGTVSVTRPVFVVSSAGAGTITGSTTVAAGASTPLADALGGGTWSSSDVSVATVDGMGVVSGVSPGTCTISYAMPGCTGTVYATAVITVTTFNGLSGNVLFTGAAYYGNVKVWLITYNSSTHILEAVDSILATSSGYTAYYAFPGAPTDSFRVKAATDGAPASPFGYIPTYHNSSAMWSAAWVIPHTSGAADINKNITMGYGATTTGPGFIGGDVTMGANKGTAGSIPAVGMLMYLENNSTGAVLQKTYTDAAGHYAFSNLVLGQVYKVYPELMNYGTTPYSTIILTTASPSKSNISFEQHTVSHTITPIATAVNIVAEPSSSISAFPNPTSGKLNVNWYAIADEHASITVTDITGRQAFQANANMAKGAGAITVDLSGLNNGLYMISVKSESVNYNSKIQVLK